MSKNLTLDFKNKVISYRQSAKAKTLTAQQLYSLLMNEFDEPENMKYEIPIKANSRKDFELINGWTIDKTSLKFTQGKIS